MFKSDIRGSINPLKEPHLCRVMGNTRGLCGLSGRSFGPSKAMYDW